MKRLCPWLGCVALAVAVLGCGPGAPGGPSMNNKIGGNELPANVSRVVSQDILTREPLVNLAQVKHILISWRDIADNPRAKQRSKADAEAEVTKLVEQIKGGANFDELMKAKSEDGGSALTARAYKVEPTSSLVIEFRQLSLRLRIDEIGVCESEFGFHIIKRVE